MFIVGNLFNTIGSLLDLLLLVYMWIIIIRALLPWLGLEDGNPGVKFINVITDPLINLVQKYLPLYNGIDFSPFVIVIIIYLLRGVIISSIFDIGRALG